MTPALERFLSLVEKGPACWEWVGAKGDPCVTCGFPEAVA